VEELSSDDQQCQEEKLRVRQESQWKEDSSNSMVISSEVDSYDILLLENKESQQELSIVKNIHARFLELLSAASG
jgi:hypothetical protein